MGLREEILLDSPTAYFPINEAPGSTVLTDTQIGQTVTAVPDMTGVSLGQHSPTKRGFNISSSRYFQRSNIPNPGPLIWALDTDLTLEFLHRRYVINTTTYGIVALRLTSIDASNWGVFYISGTMHMDVKGSGNRWDTGWSPPDLNWHHLVFRHRGSDGYRSLWVDGVEKATATWVAKPTSVYTGNPTLGIGIAPAASACNGGFSDFAIYNGAYLPDARIKAHWRAIINEHSLVF